MKKIWVAIILLAISLILIVKCAKNSYDVNKREEEKAIETSSQPSSSDSPAPSSSDFGTRPSIYKNKVKDQPNPAKEEIYHSLPNDKKLELEKEMQRHKEERAKILGGGANQVTSSNSIRDNKDAWEKEKKRHHNEIERITGVDIYKK